jgi:hypothetical protein
MHYPLTIMRTTTRRNGLQPLIDVSLSISDKRAYFEKLRTSVENAPLAQCGQAYAELFCDLRFGEKYLGDINVGHCSPSFSTQE